MECPPSPPSHVETLSEIIKADGGRDREESYSSVTFGFQFKVRELADEKTMGLLLGGNPRNKLEYSTLVFSLFLASAGGQV